MSLPLSSGIPNACLSIDRIFPKLPELELTKDQETTCSIALWVNFHPICQRVFQLLLTRRSRVCHRCSYQILMYSVIYYYTEPRQHKIYLFYMIKSNMFDGDIISTSVLLQMISKNQSKCLYNSAYHILDIMISTFKFILQKKKLNILCLPWNVLVIFSMNFA